MSSGDPQASETTAPVSPSSDAAPQGDSPVIEQVAVPPAGGGDNATVVVDAVTADSGSSASLARGSGPLAARGLGVARPTSPTVAPAGDKSSSPRSSGGKGTSPGAPRNRDANPNKPMGPSLGPFKPKAPGNKSTQQKTANIPVADSKPLDAHAREAAEDAAADAKNQRPANVGHVPRVAVPNRRQPLSDDLLAELEAELSGNDVTSMLAKPAGLEGRRGELEEGQRVRAQVLKVDDEYVYFALGGPDEGATSRLQFETLPEVGAWVEVVVRGFNREDGLYNLVVPGQAVDVNDWEDLEEGTVVEAHVAAANTGGLEATVGNIRGFIPISQIALYRVEDTAEFVGQRLMCVVTESNPRRKNLVLSRRSLLEREREEQRQEQLEKIEPGLIIEGTVSSVRDFGAFVDLGGVDGLIHVTRLSWDKVKHPSDVLEVGQKVKVKVEKIDKQTGKISLSYRDLLENPWDTAEASFAVGSVTKGTVSRIANFGAFVRLAAGIEGLVHISELAGHRVSNVSSVLKEGEEVSVKILSLERESQKIALSIKQAQSKATNDDKPIEVEAEEPPREVAVKRQHSGPLKGGVGSGASGNPFGLNW